MVDEHTLDNASCVGVAYHPLRVQAAELANEIGFASPTGVSGDPVSPAIASSQH